jgi:hypothetical protein
MRGKLVLVLKRERGGLKYCYLMSCLLWKPVRSSGSPEFDRRLEFIKGSEESSSVSTAVIRIGKRKGSKRIPIHRKRHPDRHEIHEYLLNSFKTLGRIRPNPSSALQHPLPPEPPRLSLFSLNLDLPDLSQELCQFLRRKRFLFRFLHECKS